MTTKRYPLEGNAICPTCGAKPGRPCYGNGPMPPNSHRDRGIRALLDEIDRLRDQLDKSRNSKELSNQTEVVK